MTKRTATLAALALAAASMLVGSGPSAAAAPPCKGKVLHAKGDGFGGSDIIQGDTIWQAAGGGFDITVQIKLAGPSCTEVGYRAEISRTSGGAIDDGTVTGDGANDVVEIVLHAPAADVPIVNETTGQRCVNVSATTSSKTVLDTAPDTGAVAFCSPSGGGVNFQ